MVNTQNSQRDHENRYAPRTTLPGNNGAFPAPKLLESPILLHSPPRNVPSKSVSRITRSLSPARSGKASKGSPVRQSGSPERRLRIQELEMSLRKRRTLSPESGPRMSESGSSVSENRPFSNGVSPQKGTKRIRFAGIDSGSTVSGIGSAQGSPNSEATLAKMATTITEMGATLEEFRETQKTILGELLGLKRTVELLQRQAASGNK